MKGAQRLSFSNGRRKIMILIVRLLQGRGPPLEFGIAVGPMWGANFSF